MENAAYIGLSRQITLRRQLDIVANNIANAETTGFKVEQLLVSATPGRGAENDGVRHSATFVMDNGVGRDFAQGQLRATQNPYDLAIEGADAFFQVEGDRFTRAGAFTVDDQGRLTTAQGLPVLDAGGAEITLDRQRGAPSIAADGTITQEGQAVGQIGLYRFPDLGVLAKEGDGFFRNTSNAQPEAAEGARIRQGYLEGSNVNVLTEITELVEIQRAYERITRLIEQNTDLSRRSVERLGRVS
ncbi:flagellar basal-body rod protein FlgF [Brevundimonas sp. 2R-24]|uniref:Flagellar basal-body rod protein FlgF n=1 Tax=Peiella sedimenti TaxID=3061083 RepID=A0ABT8SPQ3_9CAUL|nr:flagellar basal-body rod protein FlgF [Caulobacteraceae bacterium XZ-24]